MNKISDEEWNVCIITEYLHTEKQGEHFTVEKPGNNHINPSV